MSFRLSALILIFGFGAIASAQNGPRLGRPQRTPEEYAAFAAELRVAYARPSPEWPKPHVDAEVAFVELGPVVPRPAPPENPLTPAKVVLGKTLFFDPRISGSGQDRKSTRLNSSHITKSYAAFCLTKKNTPKLKEENTTEHQ